MANAYIRIEYLREAQQRLDDVGERAFRIEPALRSPSARRALQRSEERLFAANRFTKNTAAWDRAKARRGLARQRMQATGALRMALTGAYDGATRFTAYAGVLTWGLLGGRMVAFYARILANRDKGRRVVKVDRRGRADMGRVVITYVDTGSLH